MKYECKKCKAINNANRETCWCCGSEDLKEIDDDDDDVDFYEADFMNDFGDS